jgi:predicted Holliday junction resolvase-like endonuclease
LQVLIRLNQKLKNQFCNIEEKFSKNINILIQKEFADVQNQINKSIFSGNKLSADLKKQDKAQQRQIERKSRSLFGSVFNSLEKMSRKFEDYKYDPKNQ